MSRPTDRMLRQHGWKRHREGLGWVKNGAYYGPRVNAVSQFTDEADTVDRMQMYIDPGAKTDVVLHMIDAFAAARDVHQNA